MIESNLQQRAAEHQAPLEATVELAGRERRMVASILGADCVEHGIALHESAEALARFVDLAEHECQDEMRRMPVRSLTIGPEPAWVANAVRAVCGEAIA